jgi:hypothetical protein
VVNELTTVASAYTAARFINGTSISGNPLGLRIAAGNAPNLVDPVTGTWGKVLLDPLNSYMTATPATLVQIAFLFPKLNPEQKKLMMEEQLEKLKQPQKAPGKK